MALCSICFFQLLEISTNYSNALMVCKTPMNWSFNGQFYKFNTDQQLLSQLCY